MGEKNQEDRNYPYLGYDVDRNGVRLIEVEMECGDELPAKQVTEALFGIRAGPHGVCLGAGEV